MWKVSIAYQQRIAGKGFVAVNLNCSKCGYNAKAYTVNKDLVAITIELKEIKDAIKNLSPQSKVQPTELPTQKKKRFRIF